MTQVENAETLQEDTVLDQSDAQEFVQDEEQQFRTFVGPNADKFMKVYDAVKNKKNTSSSNWIMLIGILPWFFYRKMYLLGLLLFFVPIVIILIFPDLGSVDKVLYPNPN
ncbi:DUF2628 domain-containing protein [Terasakiella sp. A23]|uniref:DUF2628 domain-containing protein n=1 Tax=Terasakiella sp. FCG-A23 TaxID=3080561 RepID=UPI0029530E2F|nr:DUF2628 domain-containing protein [Terasakiella sp. A23]MDV7340876.1 DUF2628 domain-containing protein [Terasakiella sp. A23]